MIDDKDIIVLTRPDLTAAERLWLPQILGGMWVTVCHWVSTWIKNVTGKSYTVQYPEVTVELKTSAYRGLHRLNRDEQGRVACVACFMCSTACPANCIHIEADESPWPDREKYPAKFDIDELRCIYCGMCEEACPVDAIELTSIYDFVGQSRSEMILDKEQLLSIYDKTKDAKPRKNPYITGYRGTGESPASHPDHRGDSKT